MPFISGIQDHTTINFLASEKFQAFSVVVPQSLGGTTGIVKAGTIYPANGATAQGILLHDVDVKNGDNVGSLVVEGYVIPQRLPVVPVEAAITALKGIKFRNA